MSCAARDGFFSIRTDDPEKTLWRRLNEEAIQICRLSSGSRRPSAAKRLTDLDRTIRTGTASSMIRTRSAHAFD